MNLIPWNIVRKDFSLTRFYLVAWWGIFAAGLYNIHWCLNKIISDPNILANNIHGDYLDMLTDSFAFSLPFYLFWVFVALGIILLMMVVDIVIKADSPIDEFADWRTRPVSGLGVWRAKVFYFGCFFLLLPWSFFTLFYLIQGGRLVDAGLLMAQWGMMEACLIALIVTAAVLCKRTFSGLLVYVGIVLVFFLFDQAYPINEDSFDALTLSFRQGWINAGVSMGIFVFTGLAVSAMVYDGRRRTPCRVVLGGGVVAAFFAAVWSGSEPDRSPTDTLPPPQPDNRIKISLYHPAQKYPAGEVLQLYFGRMSPADPSEIHEGIEVQFEYQTKPSEVCLITSLNWKFTFSNPAAPMPLPSGDRRHLVNFVNLAPSVAAAGYGTLLNGSYSFYPYYFSQIIPLMLGAKEDLDRLGPSSVKIEGQLTGIAGHLQVVSDEPLAQSVTALKMAKLEPVHFDFPSETFVGNIQINRWEIEANIFRRPSSYLRSDFFPSPIVLLYNPLKNEAVQGRFYREGTGALSIYSQKLGEGSFDLSAILGKDAISQQQFGSKQDYDTWVASHAAPHQKTIADWLTGARLIELRFVPDRAIYNTVTLDAIPLNAPAPAAAAGTSNP